MDACTNACTTHAEVVTTVSRSRQVGSTKMAQITVTELNLLSCICYKNNLIQGYDNIMKYPATVELRLCK